MKEKNNSVPQTYISALSAIGEPAIPELLKLIQEQNPFVALYAVDVLDKMKNKAATIPALIQAMNSKNPWAARAAAKILLAMGMNVDSKEHIPVLLDIIQKNKPGRDLAVMVLAGLKPEPKTGLSLFTQIAGNPKEKMQTRLYAAIGLCEMGTAAQTALPTLRKLQTEKAFTQWLAEHPDKELSKVLPAVIKIIEGKTQK